MYEDDYHSWFVGLLIILIVVFCFVGYVALMVKYPIILVGTIVVGSIWLELRRNYVYKHYIKD